MKSMELTVVSRLLMKGLHAVAIFVIGVSTWNTPAVYGQQEIDPAWYNPWPSADKVDAQPSRPPVAHYKIQKKIHSASSEHRPAKPQAKRPGTLSESAKRDFACHFGGAGTN